MFFLLGLSLWFSTLSVNQSGVPDLLKYSLRTHGELAIYQGSTAILDCGRFQSLRSEDPSLPVSGGCCGHTAVPSLSQDGSQVAYVSRVSTNPWREGVFLFDLRTNTARKVAEFLGVWTVAWSPDGEKLAVTVQEGDDLLKGDYDLKIIRITDSETISFRDVSHLNVVPVSAHTEPSWNPTATSIAFGDSTLVIWDIPTGTIRTSVAGSAPSWSPDGQKIVYIDATKKQLGVLDPKTGLHAVLSGTASRYSLHYPAVWSPDGTRFLYHVGLDEALRSKVFEFDVSKNKSTHITTGARVVAWRASMCRTPGMKTK